MTETIYTYGTAENAQFLAEQRDALFNFGTRFPSEEGSSYWLGDDGTPWVGRDRATWITCRMTHVYALAAFTGFEGAEKLVDAGLKGLLGQLHDDDNDGWYPAVSAQGEPAADKQCYAHAFVLLAASSALALGRPGAKELLEKAQNVFLERFWDDGAGLSVDTWNTAFTQLDSYRGLNANMHSVEAFLAVSDVTGDESWRKRAGSIISHVIEWAEANEWHIPEHFSEQWVADLEYNSDRPDDQFKPYGATPGHGIEWARLITQYALSAGLNEQEKQKLIEAAEQLFTRAMADAWNADGAEGIVYTTDWEGKPVVHDRMHWTLAEAINTSAVLARVTGKDEYKTWYSTVIEYTDKYLIDRDNGSWFHQLDRESKVLDTVWPGKADLYHAVQSMMIPVHDPALSVAVAVKNQAE